MSDNKNPVEPFAHYCWDWDLMFIRPGDPEFECCLCFRRSPHDTRPRISLSRVAELVEDGR